MPKKILLADDSITIQKVVELTFSDGDYEVTAVNNGAKAIQKLAEMRPDIILSDIIMPEKNGYEVCEYVKSHPEYRNIPVILLTGTFEPFDPDRADKAGCDAVVTKPFESQSLIHKVEELIQQSQSSVAAAEQEPAAATADPFAHDNDIFSAAPPMTPSFAADMPFDAPSEDFSGETRAFSRMSFEEMQQMANEPSLPTTAPQPAMPEPELPPIEAAPVEPPAIEASAVETSPWDEAPSAFGGETRAFPRMSFEEMQQMAAQPSAPPPPPPPAPEPSPWDVPEADDASTRAIPKMSFEEMRQMAEASQEQPAPFEIQNPAPEPEASPWDEQPASFAGETRAFTRMSFEEMQQLSSTPAASPEPSWSPTADPFAEPEPEPAAEEPDWSMPAPVPEEASEPLVNSQITGDVNPQITDVNPQITDVHDQIADADVNSQITDVNPQITDLTDEQVDRIARRVVQMMSEQVVRNI
ncbi:MAG TPA: response regulator, partial [Thermoanaerobaculia bacterium]